MTLAHACRNLTLIVKVPYARWLRLRVTSLQRVKWRGYSRIFFKGKVNLKIAYMQIILLSWLVYKRCYFTNSHMWCTCVSCIGGKTNRISKRGWKFENKILKMWQNGIISRMQNAKCWKLNTLITAQTIILVIAVTWLYLTESI